MTEPRSLRSRRQAVSLLLLLAVLLLVSALPAWVNGIGAVVATRTATIMASGTESAPGVLAAALVIGAAALALGLSGRVAQRFAGVATVLAGVIAIGGARHVIANPELAAAGKAVAATGVAEVYEASVTAGPWVALALGVVVVLAGVAVVLVRITPRGVARYEVGTQDPTDPVLATDANLWDAISNGKDPT